MTEKTTSIRYIFLIHSLELQTDGFYVALNRQYQPLSFDRVTGRKNQRVAVAFKFKRALSARQIRRLSFNADAAAERIYLYDDGCIPTASAAHWLAYSERLRRLAGYEIACRPIEMTRDIQDKG